MKIDKDDINYSLISCTITDYNVDLSVLKDNGDPLCIIDCRIQEIKDADPENSHEDSEWYIRSACINNSLNDPDFDEIKHSMPELNEMLIEALNEKFKIDISTGAEYKGIESNY